MTTRTGRRFSILFAAIAALAKTGSAAARREFLRSARVLAAVALLALFGALALPGAAQAQTTTTFVSNIGESRDRSAGSIMAQSFTAGSNPDGYTLSDVALVYPAVASGADLTVTRVKIRKDNAGAPGDLVANLLNPATFPLGILSFAAPANTTLQAGETYWVVINEGYSISTERMDFDTTSSDDQTATTADPNWSIADTRLWKNTDTASWESPSARAVMLAVNGTAAGDTPPPPSTDATLSALVVNDGSADLTLTPTFAPGTTSYTADVANSVDEVTVTPTTTDTSATTEYLDGDDATLDDADTAKDDFQVALAVGDTVFKVQVTAEDGTTTETYTVTVTRAAADTPTCTLNPGDFWCGVVTVGAIEFAGFGIVAYGFVDAETDVGALSDTGFSVGTNPYTIDGVRIEAGSGTGNLIFSLTSALTATDKEKLVLHVGNASFAFSDRTVDAGDNYEWPLTGLDWSSEDYVTLRLRAVPTSCTLNPGDLWCGAVTVERFPETGTIIGHGFVDVTSVEVVGALSDPGFSVVTNGVTTSYTIDGVFTGVGSSAGVLFFSLTSALTAADQAKLVLHVDGRSDSLAFSGVTPNAFHTYEWNGTGLDWSSEDYVTLRLREAAVLPSLSVWDAAASDDSDMAFTVTLSDPIAEEVTATWTASIAFGNTAVEADLGRTTTGMVTFAPNATTATFVLHLPRASRRGDRTFRVTLSGVSANAQLVSNWIATGTIIGLPTSCKLNPGDIWCGTVTVKEKAQVNGKTLGHGFHQTWRTDGVGSLPDRRFVYGGDSYRIDEVTVGVGGGDIPAGFLFFGMNRAFPVADEVRLALYVGNDEFKLSRAHGPHYAPTYHWRDTGLDWSSTSSVTLRLRGDSTAAAHTEDSAAPLTAAFEGLPEAHDGETAFAFRIAFSEAVSVTPEAMRTRVLTVTGGAVTGAARVDGEPGVWAITVTPNTREALSITLAPTADCEADGAVCTADGRALLIGAAHLVNGPPDYARESNTEATGTPTISGTPQVGETLTADTSGIADDDGLKNVSFSYQWLADDTAIQGATKSTYTLADADEGKAIAVEVSFTDDAGNGETLTSTATDAVAAATQPNNPATGAPTIRGTAQVGETLTAGTSGIADADGLENVTFSYQWLADAADIPGATEFTYTLSEAVEGTAISVQVSFTDDAGNAESLTSEDAAAWSAIMTVEWVYQGYGYYSTDTKKAGSLSPASFKVDGTTYTVKLDFVQKPVTINQ